MGDSWIKGVVKFIAPMFHAIVGDVKIAAQEIMDMARMRLDEAMRAIVKGAVIFLMLSLGFIFLLVGVSAFMDAVFSLVPGAGLMIIGGALILLGLFAYAMSK